MIGTTFATTITESSTSLATPESYHASSSPARTAAGAIRRCVASVFCHRSFMPACFAVAAGLRLIWILWLPVPPVGDGTWYVAQGLRLAAGEGYTVTDDGLPMGRPGHPLPTPRPTAFWPIGYPAFLGFVFATTRSVVAPQVAGALANVVLSLGIMATAASCASLFWGSPMAGRITALILALMPNHIAYTALLVSEVWFTFVLCSMVAALVRAHRQQRLSLFIGAGLLFGLAVLTKPQVAFLPALLLWSVRDRGSTRATVKSLALLYVAASLLVGPWMLRNAMVFHQVVFVSSNAGVNLLVSNTDNPWRSNGYAWPPALRNIVATETSEIRRDVLARNEALRLIWHSPVAAVQRLPAKLGSLYAFDVDGLGTVAAAAGQDVRAIKWLLLRITAQLCYLLIISAAIIGMLGRGHRHGRYKFIPLAIVVYFSAVTLVFFGAPRFHYPMVPWLVVAAAPVFAALIQQPHRRRTVTS